MRFTNQHKSLLITVLIAGTLIMAVFNLGINNHEDVLSESYYELEPEKELTPEEKKIMETLEKLNQTKPETNSAYNETDKNKPASRNNKQIAPPEDYVPKQSEESDGEANESNSLGLNKPLKPAVNKDQLSSYSKVNDILKQQQNEGVNTKSSVSFSLVDRKKVFIPIPVYLCEENGKIVITIKVNAQGNVTEADYNTSSNSKNDCLVQHALEYAKKSRFSPDASKNSQIGSITFSFIGKH